MKTSILLFLCSFSIQAFSQITIEKFCADIQIAKTRDLDKRNLIPRLGFNESIEFLLDRSSVIQLGEVINDQLSVVDQPLNPSRNTSHSVVLFSMGSGASLTEEENKLYEEARWANRKMERDYKSIESELSVNSCVRKALRIGMTDESLNAYFELIRAIKPLKTKRIEVELLTAVQKGSRHYSQSRIVRALSYQEIRRALEKSPVDKNLDLVLTFHASQDGTLFDSKNMIVPLDFLEELSKLPQIKSIAIYACYPRQVFDFYKESLASLMRSGVRVFFPLNAGVLQGMHQVPVSSFNYFAQKHNYHLRAQKD